MLSALAVVTACTLAFQVAFTRMMSSVLAYHFSFLAISLALLGSGAGSLLVYLRPSWLDRAPLDVTLARWSLAYAYLTMLAPLALVRVDYAGDDGVTLSFALNIGLACLLAALPSLAAGALVTMAIRGFPDDVGRVYAWDLVGAGSVRWSSCRCCTSRRPPCWWASGWRRPAPRRPSPGRPGRRRPGGWGPPSWASC